MRNYYEELENILQCSYDGIYITDGEGVTLRLNEAYERIRGCGRSSSSEGEWTSKNVSKEVLEVLESYDWPGNVRQLANEVERAWITSDGEQVMMEDLSDMLVSALVSLEKAAPPITVNKVISLQEAVETVERELISEVLKNQKSFKNAASVLGVDRTTILRKARKYGIFFN